MGKIEGLGADLGWIKNFKLDLQDRLYGCVLNSCSSG